jgi:phenylalanyl-tRNA synthetase beta chain
MRISLKWLQELVELPIDVAPHDIAEHLTMAGLEVEGITSIADTMKDVLIARIAEIGEIPKRPQAKLCKVDIGTSLLSVVTNSKHLQVGDFVVLALPGAKLFDGVSVEARRVFDQESNGVLCCERELGISDDNSQVMVISKEDAKDLQPGQNAVIALALDDTVFEIAITPNRPDALSHMGVARELAAALDGRSKFQNPNCREMSGPIHDVLLVNIDARDACPRYAARVIENIQIAKSPMWLRARLYACGIRPINNVVDVTNFVLLERGHPLHAFDFAKLAKDRGRVSLNIRFATQGEKLVTLDSVERKLMPDDLVIADTRGPVALAGIIGGESSEVTEDTSTILLESAYFNPSIVRKTARRQQVSTEGSYRFERGADPNGVLPALDRAADLMVQYASGKVRREVVEVYPRKIESVEILVRPKRLKDVSGLPSDELDESKIRSRFALLGIETVGKRGDSLCFRVPTFRPDLTREIDLIEEAMRLIGFGKIPCSTVFSRRTTEQTEDNVTFVVNALGNALKASGFSSALNFSFGSPSLYQLFESPGEVELIRVQNPMGEELSAMRKWLLPGLLGNVSLNLRKEAVGVQLYEFGTVFLGTSKHGAKPDVKSLDQRADYDAWANEHMHVAGVMSGQLETLGLGEKGRAFDFFDLKGALESFFRQLHIDANLLSSELQFEKAGTKWPFLHPGFSAKISLKGQEIGFVGRVHPDVQAAYDLKQPVYGFEMNVRKIADLVTSRVVMKLMPKYPAIARDVALLLPNELSALDIAKEVRVVDEDSKLIEKFGVFDVYTGKGIPTGKKSVALSFVFRSLERTLKDEEVQVMMDAMVQRLNSAFGAQVR